MNNEITIDGIKYNKADEDNNNDNYGNIKCNNSSWCNNSTWCDNSSWCDNSTKCDNSTYCDNCVCCDNSTRCNNSTRCDNCVCCDNCAWCLYCDKLVLEKYMIFNKPVTKYKFNETNTIIQNKLGCWKLPKQLSEIDISWLKANVKQFDQTVLDNVIERSIIPDNPK